MPIFSVIIPLYNKENFIEDALKSVLSQTFQDFEIIVVNDGSTDGSVERVLRYNDSRIRVIHQTNKGLSATRNTGIKNSSSKHVAFLDADDIWKQGFLEKIHDLILQFPKAKLFATNYEEIYPNNSKNIYRNKSVKHGDSVIENFFKTSLGAPIYCPSSFCVERAVFETIGYFNEAITFSEDIDFNIRANLKFILAYSDEPLITYTMFSENQITNSPLKNKVLPDFNSFEGQASSDLALKKYLDFNRYTIAKRYKVEKDWENYKRIKKEINSSNLNYKQRILLNLSSGALKLIRKIKLFLLQREILISTYD